MKQKRKPILIAVLLITAVCMPCVGASIAGQIENTYSVDGPYETTSKNAGGFTIFYPKYMKGDHPIITFGNGTAAPTMIYRPMFNHLASWGFVVIDSNSVMTQTGNQLVAGIDYLVKENNKAGSDFYNMLDTDHIGTMGHSQGGGGAINAATDPRVTCTVPMAPSPGSIRNVECPVFLVAGKTDFIVSAALVRFTSYSIADGPTVFGIVNGMGHMAFSGNAGNARGYITAWFMYHLQDDRYAGEAFIGECEICTNSKWNVDMKNFP